MGIPSIPVGVPESVQVGTPSAKFLPSGVGGLASEVHAGVQLGAGRSLFHAPLLDRNGDLRLQLGEIRRNELKSIIVGRDRGTGEVRYSDSAKQRDAKIIGTMQKRRLRFVIFAPEIRPSALANDFDGDKYAEPLRLSVTQMPHP